MIIGRTPSMNIASEGPNPSGHFYPNMNRLEFACAVMSRFHATLSFDKDGKVCHFLSHRLTYGNHSLQVYISDHPSCHHGTFIRRDDIQLKLHKYEPWCLLDGDHITFGKPVRKAGQVRTPHPWH